MGYKFESRVRFSETDEARKLTLPAALNYFQDCSTFHSEALGVGIDFQKKRDCAWVLASWQIVVGRRPFFGEKITVETWPYAFQTFLGDRNFCMYDANGEKVIWANTLWTYVDLHTGRPVKISQGEMASYTLEEKLDMAYAPRKIAVSGEMAKKEPFQVKMHHLDTNHHVNNGQYVQMAADFLPDAFEIGQMRAEYKKPARLGDTIIPYVCMDEKKCTVLLCEETEKPYAVVEFCGV